MRIPRVSGGEPRVFTAYNDMYQYSPRERG